MIIDCHGHYTTSPKELEDYRKTQIAALEDFKRKPLSRLAPRRRIERPTCPLGGGCSIH